MARSGMAELIQVLRGYTQSDHDEYTLGTVTYWTDEHIQEMLDSHRRDRFSISLTRAARNIGGTFVYHDYFMPEGFSRFVEGTASGTAAWRMRGAANEEITDGYTIDFRSGLVRFDVDQGGSARYVDCRTFDLNAAAADIWFQRAGHLSGKYDIKTDNHDLKRSQYPKFCLTMADHYTSRAGPKVAIMRRSDDP